MIKEIKETKEIKELSKLFSSELQKEIGVTNLCKVVELNAKEINKDVCHSHDFCDANQVMLNVMGFDIMGYDDIYFESVDWDEFMTEMTKVWDKAKENSFYLK